MPTNSRDPCPPTRRERHETTVERDAWCYAAVRVASVDVSRDLDTRVPARLVVDAAPRPYRKVPRSEQEAAALDAARVVQVLDGRAPPADARDGHVRDAVRARAQRTAGQTRERRIADVVRRSRQLGITTIRPTHRHDRRPAGHGQRSAVLYGGWLWHSSGMQGCGSLVASWLLDGSGARRGGVLVRVAADGRVGGCDPCR
jgi:hypothetical protein